VSAPSLSARLRAETRDLHVQAERSGVMPEFLRGQLPLEGYGALLVALHAIYQALEEGLERNAGHRAIAALRHPGFARSAALASDVAVLRRLGLAPLDANEAAQAYAAHLRGLSTEDPLRLIAHAWLRYLGDLNGGRVLERVVRERLGVPAGAMSFYRFPALADPAAAAVAWRLALDGLELPDDVQSALVTEACEGFRRHIALFEALAGAQDAAEVSSEA
jgi:heme oxygenase